MTIHSSSPPSAGSGSRSAPGASEGRGGGQGGGSRGEGGDKRERILDAAERVFAAHGFYHAKVSEIAREAGVADGTIYLYFKNKEALLIALFESRMEEVTGRLQRATDAVDDPSEKLRAFITTHLRMVKESPNLASVLTVELRQSSKFMKEHDNPHFAAFLKLLATIVADGQTSGAFQDDVPAPIAARAIFGMIDELALAWLLGGGEKFDIVRAANWVDSLILRGLKRRKT